MLIDIHAWTQISLTELSRLFAGRLVFAGLQGSYSRGEATQNSDIDMVVILNSVEPEDLIAYGKMLDALPHREKACGFISGLNELKHWERSDLLTLYWDTTPLIGSIDFLKDMIQPEDVKRAVRLGACQIYHICGHNLIHGKDVNTLKNLYKSAVYTVQTVYYLKTGSFQRTRSDLLPVLAQPEREILETELALKNGVDVSTEEFERLSAMLFRWAARLIAEYGQEAP